ncbi:MAG TPA: bacitracin ABC transporter ATP-binding protein [Lachnospiraceae bacterium]|nr:bacitracin ABC transporter ATP-binding protein [Lachnospiraceae bacterium]
MENVLKTRNLTKTFSKKTAVSNVNMNIKRGDIYGFIGRNGAGKTTLIKMIVGLSSPSSGSIELFNDKDLNKQRRKIGTVIEAPAFVPYLSAKENMHIQWNVMGSKDKSIIDKSLKLVGLDNVGKKQVKKFSLGMKQRLGIAMTLIGEPEFLILDEPTNGLDPEGIIEFRKMLKNLNQERGLTILVSSHILSELSKLATRYGIINNGVLVEEFTDKELSDRCRAGLSVKVDDVYKASEILKGELNTENFAVLNKNTIEIFDFLENPGVITKAFAKNDIAVDSISQKSADLEEYFMSVIGGNKDA